MEQSLPREYIIFDYNNLEGCSYNTIGFFSYYCISNKLKFYIGLSLISLSFLLFCIVLFLLINNYLEKRSFKTTPFITLALTAFFSFNTIVVQLAQFFGASPFWSLVALASPGFTAFVAFTYVIERWFQVILATYLSNQDILRKTITRSTIGLNILFQLVYWSVTLAAASINTKNIRVANALVGLVYFWVGISLIVMSAGTVYVGRRMTHILRDIIKFQEENKVDIRKESKMIGAIKKVQRYTMAQTLLSLGAAFGCLGVGLWGMAASDDRLSYFFYIYNFWLYILMLGMVAALAYVAVTSGKDENKTGSSSERHLSMSIS